MIERAGTLTYSRTAGRRWLSRLVPRVAVVRTLLAVALLAGCGAEDPQTEPEPGPRAGPEVPVNPLARRADSAGQGPWSLAPLPAALAGQIRREIGDAAGLLVESVQAGGVADDAGVLADDILIAVAGGAVRSPDEVEAALRDANASSTLTLLRRTPGGEWRIVQCELQARPQAPDTTATDAPAVPVAAPSPAPAASPASPSTAAGTSPSTSTGTSAGPAAPLDTSVEGCVRAYFAMLDFCRARAWGREVRAPDAVVAAAVSLLRQSLPTLDRQTRAAIGAFPAAWKELPEKWAAAPQAERDRQREVWRGQLLLPNPLLPALGPTRRYDGRNGTVVFEYPADWIAAENESEDSVLLFLAPAGTSASWQQILHPAAAPPGVLLVVSPTEDDLRAVPNLVAGARLVARKYVSGFAPGLREVSAFRIGPGALVVLRGPVPNQAGENFCWVGCVPFGSGSYLAARFLAPVAQAEALLPAFSALLASLEVSQPDEEAALQVGLAAAMIGNAVVSAGWPD